MRRVLSAVSRVAVQARVAAGQRVPDGERRGCTHLVRHRHWLAGVRRRVADDGPFGLTIVVIMPFVLALWLAVLPVWASRRGHS